MIMAEQGVTMDFCAKTPNVQDLKETWDLSLHSVVATKNQVKYNFAYVWNFGAGNVVVLNITW